MTYLEMKNLVRKLTADRLSSNQVMDQDTFLGIAFNEVIIPDFVGRHNWFFKETMVTASLPQSTYVLQMPDTLQNIELFILHTGALGTTKPLTYQTPKNFFRDTPDPALESSGFPTCYTWVNREVWLNIPTSAAWNMRVFGLTRFGKLVEATDTPTWLDADKHITLVHGVTGFVFQTIEDSKNSQIWFNIYEQGVKSYWDESEHKKDLNAHLGRFRATEPSVTGAYWLNPFVEKSP